MVSLLDLVLSDICLIWRLWSLSFEWVTSLTLRKHDTSMWRETWRGVFHIWLNLIVLRPRYVVVETRKLDYVMMLHMYVVWLPEHFWHKCLNWQLRSFAQRLPRVLKAKQKPFEKEVWDVPVDLLKVPADDRKGCLVYCDTSFVTLDIVKDSIRSWRMVP